MDENLQNIEDLFREGLEDNAKMPSPQVWNGIDNILDKDNVVSIEKKYTSLKKVALLLLFLLLGFIIYELSNRHNNNNLAKQNKEAVTNDNGNEVSTNTSSLRKLNDSVRVNSYDKQKTDTDNSLVDKSFPDSHPLVQPGNNSILEKKKDIVSDNTTPSRKPINSGKSNKNDNQSIVTDNTTKVKPGGNFMSEKKNKTKPVKDNEQVVINNEGKETDSHLPLLKQLNFLRIERINSPTKDSVDTKKLLRSLAVNKIIPLLNTKKKEGKPLRFSITLFFSPDVADYRLQDNKHDNQSDSAAEIERSEQDKFSSTVGALIDYKLNKHWYLQSGLTYSNTNIAVDPKTIYAQTDNTGSVKYRINTSSGYGYILPSFSINPEIGDSLYAFASTHTLQYICIPIAVKYNITKGKFSFNTLAGLSTNFLTEGKIKTTVEKGVNNESEVVDNLQGLKKVYFSGLTGLGVEYNLNNGMALSFAPTFRFALNSINRDVPVKSYSNSLGLAFGLKIRL